MLSMNSQISYPQEITYDEKEKSVTIKTYKVKGPFKQIHKVEEFYENGVKRFEKKYKNELKHGKQITWLPNGKTMGISNYKKGKRHGLDQMFDAVTGKLISEGNYINGFKDVESWKFYNENGLLVTDQNEIDFAKEIVGSIID